MTKAIVKIGRPSKYVGEDVGPAKVILEALQEGLSMQSACDLACVDRTTVIGWAKRYPAFATLLKRVQAEAEKALLLELKKGAPGWQAKAWVLERRFPRKWSGKVKATIAEHNDEVMRKLYTTLEPKALADVERILAEADDPEGEDPANDGPSARGTAP